MLEYLTEKQLDIAYQTTKGGIIVIMKRGSVNSTYIDTLARAIRSMFIYSYKCDNVLLMNNRCKLQLSYAVSEGLVSTGVLIV